MDVSIIIPTKNGGGILSEVLKRISEQETKYDYEVICVDSGSSDNTLSIIEQYKCKLYCIKPSEFGHGKTRNYGAAQGSGKYLIFITQDAIPADEKWLDNFIDAMEGFPEAAGGFGIHYPYPDCNIYDKRDIEGLFKGFGETSCVFQLVDFERYEREEGYRHFLAFYSDNNSCMRREVWEKFPYDDVDFAEDQIWARKIIEAGYQKLYCPSAAVYHSHNYKLRTYFSRYYDEYKGLWNLHEFRIARTIPSALVRCVRHILSEWKYTLRLSELNVINKVKWMGYSFVRNIYRYVAGYLGGQYHQKNINIQIKWDKKFSQQYKQINK